MKCKRHKCLKNAIYGIRHKQPTHCSLHRSKNEYNVTQRRCIKCGNIAMYGWPLNSTVACHTHRCRGMHKARKFLCRIRNCGNDAMFAQPTKSKPMRCGMHVCFGDVNALLGNCDSCKIVMMHCHMINGLCILCRSGCEKNSGAEHADDEINESTDVEQTNDEITESSVVHNNIIGVINTNHHSEITNDGASKYIGDDEFADSFLAEYPPSPTSCTFEHVHVTNISHPLEKIPIKKIHKMKQSFTIIGGEPYVKKYKTDE